MAFSLMPVRAPAGSPAAVDCLEQQYPPINFVYKHLHDSIRNELESIAKLVASLEEDVQREDVVQQLETIQSRYQLLEQINRYHSCVEDEVRRSRSSRSSRTPVRACCLSALSRSMQALLPRVHGAARTSRWFIRRWSSKSATSRQPTPSSMARR